jgi:hypothetical protein
LGQASFGNWNIGIEKKTSFEIIWLPWNRNAEPNMAFFET